MSINNNPFLVLQEKRQPEITTIKWFDNQKGYGFLTNEETGEDLFIHKETLDNSIVRNLTKTSKLKIIRKLGKEGRPCVDKILEVF